MLPYLATYKCPLSLFSFGGASTTKSLHLAVVDCGFPEFEIIVTYRLTVVWR